MVKLTIRHMTVPAGHLGHMSLRMEAELVADNEHPSIPARRLAERLRDLREREYGQFTQKQLARALGGADPLSIATISQWEKPGSGRLPPAATAGRVRPPVLHEPVVRFRGAAFAARR